jgi:hypothetical protein
MFRAWNAPGYQGLVSEDCQLSPATRICTREQWGEPLLLFLADEVHLVTPKLFKMHGERRETEGHRLLLRRLR